MNSIGIAVSIFLFSSLESIENFPKVLHENLYKILVENHYQRLLSAVQKNLNQNSRYSAEEVVALVKHTIALDLPDNLHDFQKAAVPYPVVVYGSRSGNNNPQKLVLANNYDFNNWAVILAFFSGGGLVYYLQ